MSPQHYLQQRLLLQQAHQRALAELDAEYLAVHQVAGPGEHVLDSQHRIYRLERVSLESEPALSIHYQGRRLLAGGSYAKRGTQALEGPLRKVDPSDYRARGGMFVRQRPSPTRH